MPKEKAMAELDRHITILMADDDEDDRFMAEEALGELDLSADIRFVEDGEALIEYLSGSGAEVAGQRAVRPDLILLDLNMPRKDGREALKEIKADPDLRKIPVVILTTSRAEEDIARTYSMGANSFITKPDSFDDLLRVMSSLSQYWFKLVSLPSQDRPALEKDRDTPCQNNHLQGGEIT
jgi:CheY-like chemotaxis protein